MMLYTQSYLLIEEVNIFYKNKDPRENSFGATIHYWTNLSPFLLNVEYFRIFTYLGQGSQLGTVLFCRKHLAVSSWTWSYFWLL